MNPLSRQNSVAEETTTGEDITVPRVPHIIFANESKKDLPENENSELQSASHRRILSGGTEDGVSRSPVNSANGMQSPVPSSSGPPSSLSILGTPPRTTPPEQAMKIPTSPTCQGDMNQMCKVCGEPAAGFHFGAFTCEGCKSFFGRTYNNMSTLNECKNGGRCIINKKTRTSCKSCRLKKCLMVGMSKSGSRYGRRSNWFKIHYLLHNNTSTSSSIPSPSLSSSLGHESLSPDGVSTNIPPTTLIGAAETRSFNLVLQNLKCSQRMKPTQDQDFCARSGFRSYLDLVNRRVPTPPLAESRHSDSPVDLNQRMALPPPSEQMSSRDILSLCSLPTLAPRLPSLMSQNSMADRCFYSYYPSFLSAYSRQQYLNALLDVANKRDRASPANLNESSKVLLPQGGEFSPPSKVLKPNPIIERIIQSTSHKATGTEDLQNPADSNQGGKLNQSSMILERIGSPTTDSHDCPLDLSQKRKAATFKRESNQKAISEGEDSGRTDDKMAADVKKAEKSPKLIKNVQESPLDLSSAKPMELKFKTIISTGETSKEETIS